jgi:hypothetical protein
MANFGRRGFYPDERYRELRAGLERGESNEDVEKTAGAGQGRVGLFIVIRGS